MSNSSLICYQFLQHTNFNPRTEPISRITIHHAAGVVNNLNVLASIIGTRECSYNYGIANDGKIGMYVEECNRAWTSSSRDNDMKAVTIEVSNSSNTDDDWPVSAAAYNSLLNLCEDICRRNGIKCLTYTGQLAGSNLTMHKWFKATGCPGPYLSRKFPEIAATVNKRLGVSGASSYLRQAQSSSGGVTADYSSSGGILGGYVDISMLNYDALDPYIITVNRSSIVDRVDRLQDIGVVGAVIEAGYLYDSIHREVSTFQSPKLESQIKQFNDAKLPYGYYFDARARNDSEAKKEIYQLSFIIRINSPQLGLWVHPLMSGDKLARTRIMETYRAELERLGLKGKIGIYATRKEMDTLNWDTLSDNWLLWLVDHIDNLNEIETLLNPQFFIFDEDNIEEREQEYQLRRGIL